MATGRENLFDAVLVKDLMNKVKGKSSLAVLSGQTPIPFNGLKEFIFSMDNEIDIVAENGKKSEGGITVDPVKIVPIKFEYGARVSDEFLYATEEEQLDILTAFNNGFAAKVAKGFDLAAFHGINPRTGGASTVVGTNHFDSKVTQKGELGITGTTAKEAETTLSGSLASMKAAFNNLLGNIAIGEDITDELKQVGETVATFLTGNLIPMIGNVLASIPDLLGKDFAAAGLNMIAENSDQILESGVSFVTSLVTGIITALPYLAEAALNLVASFANAILTMDWLLVAQNLITGLKTGLETAAVETLGTDTNIVDTIMTGISEKLPEFLNKGVEMVTKIANGILESLPQLITMAGEAIVSFVSGMQSMLPTIMQKGAELILNLVNGIITNLPQIASAAGSAIIQYVAAIGRNLPSVLQSGIEIIGKLAAGLIQAIPKLIAQIPTIITNIKNEFLSVDWGKIGLNIIKGIANGLANAAGALWDAVKSALGDFKDNILGFFGIHSPSRWGEYVGNMIDQGIANGISGDAKLVTDSANLVKKAAYDPLTTDLSYTTNIGKTGNENGRRGIEERLDALEEVLITIAGKKQEVTMLLDRRELGRALLEV